MISNLSAVVILAEKYGYTIDAFHEKTYVINLECAERNCKRMNIYLTTMTVQTSLKHHKKGIQQLNRKNCSLDQLEKIMENPRIHTGKGYFIKTK